MPYLVFLAVIAFAAVYVSPIQTTLTQEERQAARTAKHWRHMGRVYGPDSDGVACYAFGTDARILSCVALRPRISEEAGTQ
ncbi:MAG: hypothetical protein RLZZ373_3257 [Pseudomonadota bacterium]|jgi:hypothetical protein